MKEEEVVAVAGGWWVGRGGDEEGGREALGGFKGGFRCCVGTCDLPGVGVGE